MEDNTSTNLGGAVEGLVDAVGDTLSDSDKRNRVAGQIKDGTVEVVTGLTETLTDTVNDAATSIVGIAEGKDITQEGLEKAHKDGGEEGITKYLAAAGVIVPGGGLIATALRAGGVSGLFNTLTGKEADTQQQQKQEFSWASLLENPGQFIHQQISGFTDKFSAISELIKSIPGEIGGKIQGVWSYIQGSIMSLVSQFTPMLSGLTGSLASTDSGNNTPELDQNQPGSVPSGNGNQLAQASQDLNRQVASAAGAQPPGGSSHDLDHDPNASMS